MDLAKFYVTSTWDLSLVHRHQFTPLAHRPKFVSAGARLNVPLSRLLWLPLPLVSAPFVLSWLSRICLGPSRCISLRLAPPIFVKPEGFKNSA